MKTSRALKPSRRLCEGFAKAPRAPPFGNDSSDNDKPPHSGSDSDTCCQCASVYTDNLHHRKLEFDSKSLGLLALLSVLRVDV